MLLLNTHTLTVVRLTVCACGESDSEQSNDDSTRCGEGQRCRVCRKVYHDVIGWLSKDNEANCCLNPQTSFVVCIFFLEWFLFSFYDLERFYICYIVTMQFLVHLEEL